MRVEWRGGSPNLRLYHGMERRAHSRRPFVNTMCNRYKSEIGDLSFGAFSIRKDPLFQRIDELKSGFLRLYFEDSKKDSTFASENILS